MIITYHGVEMVKVSHGDWVAVFNPISAKATEAKPSRFGADLALVSINDPAYNGVAEVTFGERQPFVIDGPGEYERQDFFIHGFASTGLGGKQNSIFDLVIDGKRLLHLGALTDASALSNLLEDLVPVDILFIGLGGLLINPAEAYKLALSLAPKVIVPLPQDDSSLKQFLKEAGSEEVKPIDKLVVKNKELLEQEETVVVLSSS